MISVSTTQDRRNFTLFFSSSSRKSIFCPSANRRTRSRHRPHMYVAADVKQQKAINHGFHYLHCILSLISETFFVDSEARIPNIFFWGFFWNHKVDSGVGTKRPLIFSSSFFLLFCTLLHMCRYIYLYFSPEI